MAVIARSSNCSIDTMTAQFAPQITGLYAGEGLTVGDPCYIKSADGKVWRSLGTAANEAANVIGFASRTANTDEPVTLLGTGTRFQYSDSLLTPGSLLYLTSGSAGVLSTGSCAGDSTGVAWALNTTDIVVKRGPNT